MNEQEVKDCPLELVLTIPTYEKIMLYTLAVDTEITGFADVSIDYEKNIITTGEVYLLEQTAGGAGVVMDEEAVSSFNFQMIKKGIKQLPKLWWHSHVKMETFFSGTDVEAYTNSLKNDSWMIALVVNKHRDMKAILQVYRPVSVTFELPVRVDWDSFVIPKSIQNEVKRKVKPYSYKNDQYTSFSKNEKKSRWIKKNGILIQNESIEDQIDRIEKESEEEIEREYSAQAEREGRLTVNGIQYVRVLSFPRSKSQAEERIANLGLVKKWSEYRECYVWCDEVEGNIWEDYWQVLDSLPAWEKGKVN